MRPDLMELLARADRALGIGVAATLVGALLLVALVAGGGA